MKNTLTIILILLSHSLMGQQLKFNNEFVDTIFIRADLSAYQFGDNETTKGKANIIALTFYSLKNHYVIDHYYKEEYIHTLRPDTIKIERKVCKSYIGESIDSKEIQSLLSSLSTQTSNQKIFEQIDTAELKEYLTGRQIRKVAKLHDVDWHFKRKHSSKEDNIEFSHPVNQWTL